MHSGNGDISDLAAVRGLLMLAADDAWLAR